MEIKYRDGSVVVGYQKPKTDYVNQYLYNRNIEGFANLIAEYLCRKDTEFAKEMVEYFGDEFIELHK